MEPNAGNKPFFISNTDLGRIDAPPVPGNFTSDSSDHLENAIALATSITGGGFEAFANWNDEIQQQILWLLLSELRRAKQAQCAENDGVNRDDLRASAARGQH